MRVVTASLGKSVEAGAPGCKALSFQQIQADTPFGASTFCLPGGKTGCTFTGLKPPENELEGKKPDAVGSEGTPKAGHGV